MECNLQAIEASVNGLQYLSYMRAVHVGNLQVSISLSAKRALIFVVPSWLKAVSLGAKSVYGPSGRR